MKLDNLKIYQKLDKHQVGRSIELLPNQIKQALDDSQAIEIPEEYKKCSKILINGMGGSSLGAHMVRVLFAEKLKVVFNIESGYILPNYVDKDTLYIIVSYSGTTEEPISTYLEAKKRGAKILAITEDNPKTPLYNLIKTDNIPSYIFKPTNNPSKQPRLGVGYTVFGIISLLIQAEFISMSNNDVKRCIDDLRLSAKNLIAEKPTKNNVAKKIALTMLNKAPIIVGAEHITGNLHILRNQINECAKQYSSYLVLPDLNHYAMEGLVNPKSNKNNLLFFFIDSKLYHPRVQKRARLTKQVVSKNGIKVVDYKLKSKTKLGQALEMLQLGSWISYYLGISNSVDPVKIPWVDWFKKQLK